MRLAIIALILFAGLTAANVFVYERQMRGLQNPYAQPATVAGAVVGAAAAHDASAGANRDVWLREAGALALAGLLWFAISRAGRHPSIQER